MKARYHMRSRNWEFFIEAPFNSFGLEYLKRYRASDPDFKFQRIKEVLQAYPNKVENFKKTQTT